MQLTITIRKEVDETIEAENIFNLVKERLNDRNDVKLSAHVSQTLEKEEPTE